MTVDWKGGLAFEVDPDGDKHFLMGSNKEQGGDLEGPSPLDMLIAAAAGCSAMDVISILQKMRLTIDSYRIEIETTRDPEGQWPRPFRTIVLRHVLRGKGLDAGAVERAVQLSDEKYCSVIATLRASPSVTSEFRIETA